jgi:hypothetical protein
LWRSHHSSLRSNDYICGRFITVRLVVKSNICVSVILR